MGVKRSGLGGGGVGERRKILPHARVLLEIVVLLSAVRHRQENNSFQVRERGWEGVKCNGNAYGAQIFFCGLNAPRWGCKGSTCSVSSFQSIGVG